jgi:transcriptional regulator with XRE-family HTH domain
LFAKFFFTQQPIHVKTKETLCQRLGIKQEDMANYLGVSKHLMAQYETEKRNLPHDARLKLARLELLLQKSHEKKTARPLPFARKHAEKTAKHLQRHAAGCQYKASRAEKKLAAMQSHCEKAKLLLQLLDMLDEQLEDGEPDKLWVHIMRDTALEKLEQNGLPAQTKVQIRINSLRQEEQLAREMLAGV